MLSLLVALSLAAEGPAPAEATSLEARVAALEAKVVELEAALKAQAEAPDTPSVDDESAASSLVMMVREQLQEGKTEDARILLKRLYTDYPDTKATKSAERLRQELDTIGTPLPTDWDTHVLDWLVKSRRFNPSRGVTIAVFWETWCPHCRREMPSMNALYAKHKADGLKVIGFTKQSRGTTREQVMDFIEEHQLAFPIAQEDGEISKSVSVKGIPAAAIYKDGVVVWRGHPARIDDTVLSWVIEAE